MSSGELLGFKPPIRRSWLLADVRRDGDRPKDISSNDVRVWDRAKLTCFVLVLAEKCRKFDY